MKLKLTVRADISVKIVYSSRYPEVELGGSSNFLFIILFSYNGREKSH